MTKRKRGGNTNLYSGKIRVLNTRRRRQRKKDEHGGGIFHFLKTGLQRAIKRAPTSLKSVAKRAISEGATLAKKQLQKKSVQRALKTAVKDAAEAAANHVLTKVGNGISSSPTSLTPLPRRRKKTRSKIRR